MDKKKTSINNQSKKTAINIKNMGVNIDKNEYKEIVQSNSNNPEKSYLKREFYD